MGRSQDDSRAQFIAHSPMEGPRAPPLATSPPRSPSGIIRCTWFSGGAAEETEGLPDDVFTASRQAPGEARGVTAAATVTAAAAVTAPAPTGLGGHDLSEDVTATAAKLAAGDEEGGGQRDMGGGGGSDRAGDGALVAALEGAVGMEGPIVGEQGGGGVSVCGGTGHILPRDWCGEY